jgi:hypothetical protein
MSRIGIILAKGKICFDTLLMHNMTSAWICFDNGDCKCDGWIDVADEQSRCSGKDTKYYDAALIADTRKLESKHIPFHLGDEILMERHGRVEGNKLITQAAQ